MVDVRRDLRAIVERQLSERAARNGSNEPGRLVTTVHCAALQNLQFRATVEGHEFISDEHVASGGHDAGPAPLRYFLGGIMMCHQVWCMKQAVVRGIHVDRLEGEIAGYVGPLGSGFDRLKYRIDLDVSADGDLVRQVIDAATVTCPAFLTVARSTPISVTVVHNGSTLLEREYGGVAADA